MHHISWGNIKNLSPEGEKDIDYDHVTEHWTGSHRSSNKKRERSKGNNDCKVWNKTFLFWDNIESKKASSDKIDMWKLFSITGI